MPASKNSYNAFPATDYINLLPFQSGREFCTSGYSFGPATRSHYLFHYVISGRGTLLSQDQQGGVATNGLSGGQGFMIFPGQVNTYMADTEDPWVYTWIEFDGVHVGSMLEGAGLTPSSPVYKPASEEFRSLVERELLFLSTHPDAPALQIMGHLYLFFDALLRSASQGTFGGKLHDIHVQDALRFVEHNYGKDITVADIAKSTGLNPSYFGKLFKKATGRTPQQHLINYRMEKAEDLLKLTSMSIAEVGKAVGYPNQLHFSRAFKNAYGLSPRAWRKQNSSVTINRDVSLHRG